MELAQVAIPRTGADAEAGLICNCGPALIEMVSGKAINSRGPAHAPRAKWLENRVKGSIAI